MASVDIGSILILLLFILVLAKASSAVFDRFGIPGLIGEILIGIFIANLVIGDWSLTEFLGLGYTEVNGEEVMTTNQIIFDTLAELGVIFLLFAVGLETRVKDLMSVGKAAFLVALLGVITPFVLGYAFIMIHDGNTLHALFMGAAMVATSVGITARVIKDLGLTATKESRIIIGAAVIDDVMGMVVLAIVAGMARPEGVDSFDIIIIMAAAILFVLAIIIFCKNYLPKIHAYVDERKKRTGKDRHINMFAIAIITCFALSALAQVIGLAAIIGAFLAGMLFADRASEWKLDHKFDSLNVFLVSFFFVNVGLKVELDSFTSEVLLIGFVVIIIAIISKYVGCSLGAKIGDKTTDRTSMNIIGIGMIPRGEVGIIVASIGLAADAISPSLYAVVVMMSVVTTIISPFFFARAFKKKYRSDIASN